MSEADRKTADAFAQSWNRVDAVYSRNQFLEWLEPLTPDDLRGRDVLELGFGNGSLLAHVAKCGPATLTGIELADTLEQAKRILSEVPFSSTTLLRGDLTTAELGGFDVVYCIGVLHHLDDPEAGFDSVLRHTRQGGRFHCWVYAREGTALIRLVVEPIRRVTSKLPWWITKYAVALPLVTPYYLYAKALRALRLDGQHSPLRVLPLFGYTRWIAGESFPFFHHVAFDQLVTPRTRYIDRPTIERWLSDSRVDETSAYVVHRNDNSWKFGGRRCR